MSRTGRVVVLLATLLGLWALPASAASAISGWCEAGGQAVVTAGLASSSPNVMASYPRCTVTVYAHGTLTLASLCSDNSAPGCTTLANPFTANSDGSWRFYLAPTAPSSVDITTSGGTPFTMTTTAVTYDIAATPLLPASATVLGTDAGAQPIAATTTGTGTTVVLANGPTLIAPTLGAATATSLSLTGQLTSTLSTGTAPLVVASTTQVVNLNAAACNPACNLNGTATSGTTGTGAVVLAAAPTLTGHPTIEGVTSTGATGTGKLVFDTAPTLNPKVLSTVRYADQFAGADIFAKVNAAYSDCSSDCTVIIPAGTYNSVTTTLNLPTAANGTTALRCDEGATINYTGSGHAIEASGNGTYAANINIYGGCRINGTVSGLSGLHLKGISKASLYTLRVSGFSAGAGLLNEGSNKVDCFACELNLNLYGAHEVGVVISASNYSANANHFFGGQMSANTGWGAFEDGSQAGTVGPNQNNLYLGVVMENNGLNASPTTTGNVFIQRCDKCAVIGGYIEYSSGQTRGAQIVAGDSSSSCGGAGLCVAGALTVRDNFFSEYSTVTNTVSCVNCTNATVRDNEDVGTATNFFNNGSASLVTYLGFNAAGGTTNYSTGSGTYAYLFDRGNNVTLLGFLKAKYFSGTEISSPGGTAALDVLWPDSATHRWSMSNNNGAAETVGTIALYSHGGTEQGGAPHAVVDSCTLGTDCAVTLVGAAVFSSSTSYTCGAEDQTTAAATKVVQASGSSFTVTGTGTDAIRYTCIGN